MKFESMPSMSNQKKEVTEELMQDQPLDFAKVLQLCRESGKHAWANEEEVRSSIKKMTEKVPSKFKDFADYKIKSLQEFSQWEKMEKFFSRMGIKNGLENIQVVITDNEEFWHTFLGRHSARAIFEPKSMFVVRSIFEVEQLIRENASLVVAETGKLIFHDLLGEKSEQYQQEYQKENSFGASAMDSMAYQLQIQYLRDLGNTLEESRKFLHKNLDKLYGTDEEITEEENAEKKKEEEMIDKYLENVYSYKSNQAAQEKIAA